MTKQLTSTNHPNKGAAIIAAFRASGKTRTEFCRQTGLKLATFDYYHHRVRAEEQTELIPVKLVNDSNPAVSDSTRTLAVWLRNGRRLELSWHGDDSSVERLVRQLERD